MALIGGGLLATAALAAAPPDAAARFGARPGVQHLAMSPDGKRVAWVAPLAGQGGALFTMTVADPDSAKAAFRVGGAPDRLRNCMWLSDTRLACTIFGIVSGQGVLINDLLPVSRQVAIDADGGNFRNLAVRDGADALGIQLYGGEIIDRLGDGRVLMKRNYVPEFATGTRLNRTAEGLGVDRVDTATLASSTVEKPRQNAFHWVTDGHGQVRIMGIGQERGATEQSSGVINLSYRRAGQSGWQPLGSHDTTDDSGFLPYTVDRDSDRAIGFRRIDGRIALVAVALDGSAAETVLLAHPQVDVDSLLTIGLHRRVIGGSYVTEQRQSTYFDPGLKRLSAGLAKALPPGTHIEFVDSSADEKTLLIWAGRDDDPGVNYILDRTTGELKTFLVTRPALEGVKLATMKPVRFTAGDGTVIPAYLTLPPEGPQRGLPAIVMPHGGPSARDEWGFDWVAQFFASQGYAVIQPNFRGSAGYGEAWFADNGFKSWRTAIGDVSDAGRWLVKEGIADPKRLAILGWSYGGYAALQSAAVDPDLFKAVVAIAPVTDLMALKEESRFWSDYRLRADFIGAGPHITEGSPARQAARMKAPVLLFHGRQDRNVGVGQSEAMARALREAGRPATLVTFDGLDHQLEDSEARARLLRESAAFLKAHLPQ